MDSIKGAIVLRDRLAGRVQEPQPPRAPVPADALPIFHWVDARPSTTDVKRRWDRLGVRPTADPSSQ